MGAPLAGKVCAITGGAQGIGWAIAEALCAAGARVHACDISEEYLARASPAAGENIILSRCDVTVGDDLERWIRGIHEREGRIDVLVGNAAFVRWEPVERMTIEESELTMRTGYDAMVRAVMLVLPMMRAAGSGHIVAMGSSAGTIITGDASAAYAASKAAVAAYIETLRLELSGTGIGVTLVRPGVVAGTSFFQTHVRSSRLPRLADFVPAVTPAQVAAAVVNAIRRGRPVVDIPRMLPLLYLLYALFPRATRRLIRLGGRARSDFGSVP